MGKYYHMMEVWTPLEMFGVRLFKTNDGEMFMKVGKNKRKRIK